MPPATPSHRHIRHTLLGAFFGLAGLFFSLAATIRADEPALVVAPVAEASVSGPALSAETVSAAISRRNELLSRTLEVTFDDGAGAAITGWKIALADVPLWVTFRRTDDPENLVGIDAERVKQHVISYPPEGIPLPQSCTVTGHRTDAEGVERVETDCIARSGFRYDVDTVTSAVVAALERGEEKITVTLEKVPGQLIDTERSPDRPLVLLSTGRSNFKGSGAGRKSNVRKAINEHQHNIFIPEGSEFSFNDTLGIVSLSRGWQMALTIFEGVNLRPAPGGGVCQASTTVFRAVLNAGLPILEQKSHSLYVTYYEAYGVGLDATIFPGKQDFRFKNDTGGPIIMQAYTEGDEATINLYGYDDNRSVTLSGPYFAGTEGILPDGKKIRANEIVWTRTVQSAAGTSTDIVASRYQAIPRSLAKNWTASTFQTRIAVTETAPLHGAAEEIVAER